MVDAIGIRVAGSGEYLEFHKICDNHLPHPLSLEQRLEQRRREFARIDEGAVVAFFAESDGKVVGSVQLRLAEETSKEGRVHALIVQTEIRRRGVASKLMGSLEAEARRRQYSRIWLTVHSSNEEARSFYLSQGYASVEGEHPSVQDDTDILEKPLETIG